MLNIKTEVTLKSGAKVTLSPEQEETVARWVEGLVMNGVQESKKAPKDTVPKKTYKHKKEKARLSGLPWSESEHQKIVALNDHYPIGAPGRASAIKRLAKELQRSPASVEVRIYNKVRGLKKEQQSQVSSVGGGMLGSFQKY